MTGADAANHHPDGLFIERNPVVVYPGDEPQLRDVFAWICRQLD